MTLPNKIIYFYVFFPIILFLGLKTSMEDFFFSRIRNKWIIFGLFYSVGVYILMWLYDHTLRNIFVSHLLDELALNLLWNFDKWYINIIISFLVSYLLWNFKMWGAGDAKLFICYSALIPIGQYSRVYFNYYFASFLLLFYIFIPATFFLFLRAIISFIRESSMRSLKSKVTELIKQKWRDLKIVDLIKISIGFFILFLTTDLFRQILRKIFGSTLINQNFIILFYLFFFNQISSIFKKYLGIMIFCFICLVFYIFSELQFTTVNHIFRFRAVTFNTLLILTLFPISRKLLDLYTERTVKKNMPFAPWMFLGALLTWFL